MGDANLCPTCGREWAKCRCAENGGEAVAARPHVMCPHGDPTCPCPDGDTCHYEWTPDVEPMFCPNPPLGFKNLTNAHCHVEGCDWHVKGCSPDRPVSGECGLLKLGLPPAIEPHGDAPAYYSMTQARPGLPGWACGWLRTPLNVASRADA